MKSSWVKVQYLSSGQCNGIPCSVMRVETKDAIGYIFEQGKGIDFDFEKNMGRFINDTIQVQDEIHTTQENLANSSGERGDITIWLKKEEVQDNDADNH